MDWQEMSTHSGVQILNFDVDQLREPLRKMTDDQLREFGEAARYMVPPQRTWGSRRKRCTCFNWKSRALSGDEGV
jgi:hypothetical protein